MSCGSKKIFLIQNQQNEFPRLKESISLVYPHVEMQKHDKQAVSEQVVPVTIVGDFNFKVEYFSNFVCFL